MIFQRMSSAFPRESRIFEVTLRSRSSVLQSFAIEANQGKPQLIDTVFWANFARVELTFEEGVQSRSQTKPGRSSRQQPSNRQTTKATTSPPYRLVCESRGVHTCMMRGWLGGEGGRRRGTRRGGTPCLVQTGRLHHSWGAGESQPNLALSHPKSP